MESIQSTTIRIWTAYAAVAQIAVAIVAVLSQQAIYRFSVSAAPGRNVICLSVALLWAQFALLLVGVLLPAGTVALFRQRLSAALFVVGTAVLCTWLLVDVRVAAVTGNHLGTYLPHLVNPVAWEWGGSGSNLMMPFLGILCGALCGPAAGLWLAHAVIDRWLLARPKLFQCLCGGTVLSIPLAGVALFLSDWAAIPRDDLDLLRQGSPFWLLPTAAADTGVPDALRERFTSSLTQTYQQSCPDGIIPPDVDTTARVPAGPDIVLIVLESFRHDMLSASVMPKLHALSQRGLRSRQHYAGANASHLGIFGLLYGRSALAYDRVLDRPLPPQLCETLRRSGYELTYISSANHFPYLRMEQFINDDTFDNVMVVRGGGRGLPNRDRRAVASARDILRRPATRPRFVMMFLMSTHHDYQYPAEFERFRPVAASISPLDTDLARQREPILNRYRNAAYFLDDEIGRLLQELDLSKDVVIVTGDHGESILDDGCMFHASRLSEIQTRVPMFMVGAGVPSGMRLTGISTHADLLPTVLHLVAGRPVPVTGIRGHDLLATSPAERSECMLVGATRPGSDTADVLLIHNGERLKCQMGWVHPTLRVLGMRDDFDAAATPEFPSPLQTATWVDVLNRELSSLSVPVSRRKELARSHPK